MALRRALRFLVLGLALLAWSAGSAEAQLPFTLTLSGGGTLPVGSFGDPSPSADGGQADGGQAHSTEAGPSFGVQFTLRSSPWRSLYAGFSQHRFGCEEGPCPPGSTLVSTVWDLGARFHLTRTGLSPWLQLGTVIGRVEGWSAPPPGSPQGTPFADAVSDLSVGGEAGAGLEIRVGERLGVRPGVRYTLVNTRFPDGLLRMRYLVAELGLMIGF